MNEDYDILIFVGLILAKYDIGSAGFRIPLHVWISQFC